MVAVVQAGQHVRVIATDGKSASQEAFDAGLINEPTPQAFDDRTQTLITAEVTAQLGAADLGPPALLAAREGLAGYAQVEQGPLENRAKLSYSQVGDFAAPRAIIDGSIAVQGPDPVYPEGRLRKRSLPNTGPATLWIILFNGQSNTVGANAPGDVLGPITTVAPLPDKLLCYNGGIFPLASRPSAPSELYEVKPEEYASLVDAREGINPFVFRETWAMACGEVVAAAVKPGDKVLIINTGLGSCSFAELVEGFAGSRATFSGSIASDTMTVTGLTITAGDGLRIGLGITGPGIAPGTVITDAPVGPDDEPTGVEGVYKVSPAQTVASFVGATTIDPAPKPWSNGETLVADAVQKAAAMGLVPRIAAMCYNQGEAEQAQTLSTFRLTQLARLRTKTDALKAITGQSEDILIVHPQVGAPIYDINHTPASNIRNDNPDGSLMNTVSLPTLMAEQSARTLPNFATFPQYDQDCSGVPRVHYSPTGHSQMGEKAGNLILDWLGSGSIAHPYMVTCTGLLKSTARKVVLSEDAEVDTDLVTNPGNHGVRYYDSQGEVPIIGVVVSGPQIDITLARAPNGVSERVEIACSNGLVTGFYTGTAWPFSAPDVYLGPGHGQRSQIRASNRRWWSQRTGRPLDRYFAHQKLPATVTSNASTIAGVLSDLDVTPTLLLSASDPLSYPGSGQVWTDRSPGAAIYQFGTTGAAEASDPTYSAGPPPAMLFDGTDSFIRTGGADAFAELHKAGAGFMVAVIYRVGALPTIQHLASTCRNTTGGAAGIAIRVSEAGRFGWNVRGDANFAVAGDQALDVTPLNTWRVGMLGVNAATSTNWLLTSGTPTPTYGNVPYVSPTAAAAESTATIGKNGAVVSDAGARKLAAGGGIAEFVVSGYQSAEKMMPLFLAMQARLGL